MAKKSTVIGHATLAKNISNFYEGFLREVNIDMKKSEIILKKRITKNISNTAYSLKELAWMGHPYSRSDPKSIHRPKYTVHKQSGNMVDNILSGTEGASVNSGGLVASAFAGINDSVEYAKYVIYGTSKMVPRDFLTGSLRQEKKNLKEILKRSLHEVTVNFHGKKVKL